MTKQKMPPRQPHTQDKSLRTWVLGWAWAWSSWSPEAPALGWAATGRVRAVWEASAVIPAFRPLPPGTTSPLSLLPTCPVGLELPALWPGCSHVGCALAGVLRARRRVSPGQGLRGPCPDLTRTLLCDLGLMAAHLGPGLGYVGEAPWFAFHEPLPLPGSPCREAGMNPGQEPA